METRNKKLIQRNSVLLIIIVFCELLVQLILNNTELLVFEGKLENRITIKKLKAQLIKIDRSDNALSSAISLFALSVLNRMNVFERLQLHFFVFENVKCFVLNLKLVIFFFDFGKLRTEGR